MQTTMNNEDNPNQKISFTQASSSNLEFLTQKTLSLHHFETQNSANKLELSDDFEQKINHWIKLELMDSSSLIFIINLMERPIGFAFLKTIFNQNGFTPYPCYGLIQSIWIDSEHRQNKIGLRVVNFIESIFKQQEISYYEVNYAVDNPVAESFWESCGLSVTSKTARKFLNNKE